MNDPLAYYKAFFFETPVASVAAHDPAGTINSYTLHVRANALPYGLLTRDVDGYFYFWPHHERQGMIDQCVLAALAARLQELNAPHTAELEVYFNSQKATHE